MNTETIEYIIAHTRYGATFAEAIRPELVHYVERYGLDLSRGDDRLAAEDYARELAWRAEANALRARPVFVMRDSVGAPPLIASLGTLVGREASVLDCVDEPPEDLGPIASSAPPFYIDIEPERAAWLVLTSLEPPELIDGDLAYDELAEEFEVAGENILAVANIVAVYGQAIRHRWAYYDGPMLSSYA